MVAGRPPGRSARRLAFRRASARPDTFATWFADPATGTFWRLDWRTQGKPSSRSDRTASSAGRRRAADQCAVSASFYRQTRIRAYRGRKRRCTMHLRLADPAIAPIPLGQQTGPAANRRESSSRRGSAAQVVGNPVGVVGEDRGLATRRCLPTFGPRLTVAVAVTDSYRRPRTRMPNRGHRRRRYLPSLRGAHRTQGTADAGGRHLGWTW